MLNFVIIIITNINTYVFDNNKKILSHNFIYLKNNTN